AEDAREQGPKPLEIGAGKPGDRIADWAVAALLSRLRSTIGGEPIALADQSRLALWFVLPRGAGWRWRRRRSGRRLAAATALGAATAARAGATAAAAGATRGIVLAAQCGDPARRLLIVADGKDPTFDAFETGAVWRRRPRRVAVGLRSGTASIDQVADVDRGFLADDDVLAAWRERVPSSHRHVSRAARIADEFEAAHHAPAVQIAVVQFVLLHHVAFEPVEIFLGQ